MTMGEVIVLKMELDQCEVRPGGGEGDVFCLPVAEETLTKVMGLARSDGTGMTAEQGREVERGGLGLRQTQTVTMVIMQRRYGEGGGIKCEGS
jgi:hypothetical protein